MTPLETVSFAELSKSIGCTSFRVSAVHKVTGFRYLHLVTADDKYVAIKIGPKVTTEGEGMNLIKGLINDHVVYTGENRAGDGLWFTFGPEPGEGVETFEISVADFIKQSKLKASLVG